MKEFMIRYNAFYITPSLTIWKFSSLLLAKDEEDGNVKLENLLKQGSLLFLYSYDLYEYDLGSRNIGFLDQEVLSNMISLIYITDNSKILWEIFKARSPLKIIEI
jgi:hypothetical protein